MILLHIQLPGVVTRKSRQPCFVCPRREPGVGRRTTEPVLCGREGEQRAPS